MNPRMWAHAATQANLEAVRSRGAVVVGPDEGETAEGKRGLGRMAEPELIFARCRELLGESDTLAGRRVLVSAGGTREPLDAVRFLGNRSSGRMGVALAAESRKRGAGVTLLAANLAVPVPRGVDVVERRLRRPCSTLPSPMATDLVLMAAAVADYGRPSLGKRTKGKRLGASTSSRPPTSCGRWRRRRTGPGARRLRSGWSRLRARSCSSAASSFTTTSPATILASTQRRTRSCSSRRQASGGFRRPPKTELPRRS
jgi:hypothetical protein